jgi:hypothetical protein
MKSDNIEIVDDLGYAQRAVRSLSQPLLALYACCSHCGGDVDLNKVLAEFLDGVFNTGVKLCRDHGHECSAAFEENEWVWIRMSKMRPVYLCEKDASELLMLTQSAAA